MVYSIYTVGTSNIMFSYEHYIGLSLIITGWAAWRYSAFINKVATLLALVLATFSIAAFTPVIASYRLGFSIGRSGMDVVLQFYCLFLLMLFVILNWNFFYKRG